MTQNTAATTLHAARRTAIQMGADEDTPIFNSVKDQYDIKPPQVPPATKRMRHKANRLTQAVWDSFNWNPAEGQIYIKPIRPGLDATTDELPIIEE